MNFHISIIEAITISISVLSLIISIFSIRKHQFKLIIHQPEGGAQSASIITFDGCYASSPKLTGEPNYDNIALIRISLINKSASPIAITSFMLGDNVSVFADYSHTVPYFKITSEKSNNYFGFPDKKLEYLKPIINLEPYDAKSGYLFFPVGSFDHLNLEKDIDLTIFTSRGKKVKKIKFGPIYKSSGQFPYLHPEYINYSSTIESDC